jgi:hypothetical protein
VPRKTSAGRFEWARSHSLGQSFGPWIYHHGSESEPEDWCDECKSTWDLTLLMRSVREKKPSNA